MSQRKLSVVTGRRVRDYLYWMFYGILSHYHTIQVVNRLIKHATIVDGVLVITINLRKEE